MGLASDIQTESVRSINDIGFTDSILRGVVVSGDHI